MDLVELTATLVGMLAKKTRFSAVVSMRSPTSVEVPCAFTHIDLLGLHAGVAEAPGAITRKAPSPSSDGLVM